MNVRLKLALLTSQRTQYEIANEAGLSETRLSRIVLGRVRATSDERQRLSRALRRPVDELFGPVDRERDTETLKNTEEDK